MSYVEVQIIFTINKICKSRISTFVPSDVKKRNVFRRKSAAADGDTAITVGIRVPSTQWGRSIVPRAVGNTARESIWHAFANCAARAVSKGPGSIRWVEYATIAKMANISCAGQPSSLAIDPFVMRRKTTALAPTIVKTILERISGDGNFAFKVKTLPCHITSKFKKN